MGKNIMIMLLNTAAIYFILQATWLDVMLKVRAGRARRAHGGEGGGAVSLVLWCEQCRVTYTPHFLL